MIWLTILCRAVVAALAIVIHASHHLLLSHQTDLLLCRSLIHCTRLGNHLGSQLNCHAMLDCLWWVHTTDRMPLSLLYMTHNDMLVYRSSLCHPRNIWRYRSKRALWSIDFASKSVHLTSISWGRTTQNIWDSTTTSTAHWTHLCKRPRIRLRCLDTLNTWFQFTPYSPRILLRHFGDHLDLWRFLWYTVIVIEFSHYLRCSGYCSQILSMLVSHQASLPWRQCRQSVAVSVATSAFSYFVYISSLSNLMIPCL